MMEKASSKILKTKLTLKILNGRSEIKGLAFSQVIWDLRVFFGPLSPIKWAGMRHELPRAFGDKCIMLLEGVMLTTGSIFPLIICNLM